ncbi:MULTISPECIES: hypothetical protein [Lacticaseibacillus]|uniref:Extracellular protein n=2 Tax=Lacticaseibacillus TaxID=2759736 RepID=A0AAN1EXK9_LACCA|nr:MULTISPECIES: hypothetical protein [Lacticaseibacillus]ARY90301.1 hypothetical protein BGL52_00420 [Lacticaseibacillus casei]KAB1969956.1 hypothetical protein F9B82_06245 [Lacticaseibacillus casei]WLV80915.1 hypothetical protein LACSTY_000082 [Lacticaseibacillus sp. NCIMB 15473]WNX24875.1 hypothetical protein RWA15_00410 [Lacticaseibacillus casei]WNX27647.1 hypothetical protein RWA16_00410 [Lacticaseibacillus casei]
MKRLGWFSLLTLSLIYTLIPAQTASAQSTTAAKKAPVAKQIKISNVHQSLNLKFHLPARTDYSLKDLNNQTLAEKKSASGVVSLKRLQSSSTKLILKTSRNRHTSKQVINVPESYPIAHPAIYRKPVIVGSKVTYVGAKRLRLFTIQTKYLPNVPKNQTGIALTIHNAHYAVPLSFSEKHFSASNDQHQVAVKMLSTPPVIKPNETKTIRLLIDVPQGKGINGTLALDQVNLTAPINFYL